ncbi:hypothetical protein JTE90_004270 [Oedothorax gibbosus]|uniref:CFA20 domain-containing protein n=1 Tax=Oedothorax gibbosus TaxID=931172 RepID=A0AAV6U1H9_9ARAC|nr:hypothetical protein JTE90_004270 [Oedothorax gibbosus]
MSHNGQRYVELLSPTNKDILNAWKVLPGTKKVFDDKLKSFVFCLKGGKAPVPLLQWPKDKANVVLSHPIIVFQMFLAARDNILFDIRINCNNILKKRISLSSNQKTVSKTSLSVILPVTILNRETWSYLLVDIEEIVSSVWSRDSFRNVGSVCLSGNCSIKRIFTLRRDMVQNEEGVQFIKYDQIPKQMLLSKTSPPTYDFVICLNNSEAEENKSSTNSLANQSEVRQSTSSSLTSINGHYNFMKSASRNPSISKSNKNTGGLPLHTSNKSEYSFRDEDNRSKCSTVEDNSVSADHVLPLLSRLTFARALGEYTDEL